jgi:hypothetical protein
MLAVDGVNVNVSAISEPAGEPPSVRIFRRRFLPPLRAALVRAREQSLCRLNYHQQYLHRNKNGYCGLGGTGISCPVGVVKSSES